jgi:signal transduction histidine kinase
LKFLAAGVGRSFGVRRVVVSATNDGRMSGSYGPESSGLDSHLTALEAAASKTPFEVAHVGDKKTGDVGALLEEAGFHYVFPLRYEGRLLGLLLVDCAPRQYLDEDEAVLLGLSRQIAHSIETLMLIEEKIRLERALVQQEHLASLGRVAATIAHEIRNPLSSIKTLAQLMREDADVDARYSRDLGFIIGETDRLSGSVQQLLTFSRPAAEKQETVDVAAALETALDVLARQQAQEGLRLERSIEPGLSLENTSTEAVKQIVLNLALNAVQASPPGAVVHIDARRKDGLVAIAVTDQGPGISPEVRERMFEPFFTTRQKGTGLGLAIVQKNVRAMGGEIQVESPVGAGRGTCVTVTLPASPKK